MSVNAAWMCGYILCMRWQSLDFFFEDGTPDERAEDDPWPVWSVRGRSQGTISTEAFWLAKRTQLAHAQARGQIQGTWYFCKILPSHPLCSHAVGRGPLLWDRRDTLAVGLRCFIMLLEPRFRLDTLAVTTLPSTSFVSLDSHLFAAGRPSSIRGSRAPTSGQDRPYLKRDIDLPIIGWSFERH